MFWLSQTPIEQQHIIDGFSFELSKVGCNKGAALAVLSQHLGFTLQECMAFGDAMNDREMLGSVGRGFIMGNAMPQHSSFSFAN
ncbi:hypothetical protein FK521_29820, partial [Klebsiella pneumoniae]|nr:hypothetical protein [Klebsiella pneumoniae]